MLKHMTVIGRLMNIIEFLNKDGLKLRPLWSVRTRMLPATRRKLISRTHEKRRSPAPVIPGRGGTRQTGAAGVWCPGISRGRVWSGAIFFHLPTMYSVCIREPASGYAPGFAPVFGGRPEQDYIADIRTLQFIMYCTSWPHDFSRRPA